MIDFNNMFKNLNTMCCRVETLLIKVNIDSAYRAKFVEEKLTYFHSLQSWDCSFELHDVYADNITDNNLNFSGQKFNAKIP